VRYFGYLLLAVGILVTSVANAKCATVSTSERFSDAETIVLVTVESVRDGPAPWPYDFEKGAAPGKLLTLRVVRSWKGSHRPGEVIDAWTWSSPVEDTYEHIDVGAKILVFLSKEYPRDIMSCNTSPPDRINKTSEELDAITHRGSSDVDPNIPWNGSAIELPQSGHWRWGAVGLFC